MAKWIASRIATPAALGTAVEAIDNTVTILVVEDKEGGYVLIQAS